MPPTTRERNTRQIIALWVFATLIASVILNALWLPDSWGGWRWLPTLALWGLLLWAPKLLEPYMHRIGSGPGPEYFARPGLGPLGDMSGDDYRPQVPLPVTPETDVPPERFPNPAPLAPPAPPSFDALINQLNEVRNMLSISYDHFELLALKMEEHPDAGNFGEAAQLLREILGKRP